MSSAVIIFGLRILTVILFALLLLVVFPSVGIMWFDDVQANPKPKRARHRRPRGKIDPSMKKLVQKFREAKLPTAMPASVVPGRINVVSHRRIAA